MKKLIVVLVMAMFGAGTALAQSFPSKPIRLVIGQGPGGVTDVLFRLVADEMGKRLAQPVVVENRPGAGSMVAVTAVKASPADGYTLYGGTPTGFSPVYMKNGLLAGKELTPISGIAYGDWVMYVPSNLGVKSLAELTAWAKANPGKARFGASAPVGNLVMAVVARRMGFSYEYIPYNSTAQVITAVLGGDLAATANAVQGFQQHIQSGAMRAIATTGAKRTEFLSDVPTLMEQGLPLTAQFTQGLWGPLGMPKDVTAKLNTAVNEALRNPATVARFKNATLVPSPSTPEELIKEYEGELRFLTEAAEIAGFKPQ